MIKFYRLLYRNGGITKFHDNHAVTSPAGHPLRCCLPLPSSASHVSVRRLHQLRGEDVPNVTASEMKKILRSHLKSLTEGHTCLAAECPQCRNPEGQGRLTINTRTGYCFCTSCGLQGSWTDLSAYLKMKEDTKSRHGKAGGNPDSRPQRISLRLTSVLPI